MGLGKKIKKAWWSIPFTIRESVLGFRRRLRLGFTNYVRKREKIVLNQIVKMHLEGASAFDIAYGIEKFGIECGADSLGFGIHGKGYKKRKALMDLFKTRVAQKVYRKGIKNEETINFVNRVEDYLANFDKENKFYEGEVSKVITSYWDRVQFRGWKASRVRKLQKKYNRRVKKLGAF
ncbi:MAG: hypothetical protein CL944_00330 [Candidatus Diapherotrites archaeon]|uniref:Uncharacterized protein n=1 Tax=Candidatus Iainarchaeum sp. TaxID=3101447 RepID=A0A2D6LP09_9ARCH|nr:hypothetical protein [Candidatus Diapherotrites archaeon]|tara:strand:- start:16 stop:549 length:534 start_codon:yes stop_codon:yes gene_type:complete